MSCTNQTRRDFLKLAGKTVLGAAALTAVPAVLNTAKAETAVEAPAWPWTYKPLDVEEVKARVYQNFSTHGGCCAAVASGILELLAEKYGYPYNQINGRMFANGGGGYGRRNLCGSLGGAFAILGLFLTSSDSGAMRNQIYAWYETTAFPLYQPADKPEHPVHSVSGSELCKDSVGNWMAASGFEFGTPERATRCASLSADVAGKAIELLNVHFGYADAPVEEPVEEPALAANEYIGVGKGFGGDIKVKVTMDGDKISKIEVLEHGETAGICDGAFANLPDAIIAANGTAGVEAVSGATYSSKGLIEAVNNALAQVK